MGSWNEALWVSSGVGTNRRQRQSGVYYWYMPDKMDDLVIGLDPDVVYDLSRCENHLTAFASSRADASTEGIARLLLRSEALSSSHIEGLTIGTRRLFTAELQNADPEGPRFDRSAMEVLGNVRAMQEAVERAASGSAITVDTLKTIHKALAAGTRYEEIGGVVRDRQNWIGGSAFNPLSAEYVPPAAEAVPALLDDLCSFCMRDDIPGVMQAALVHSQFESIHPFADGNGRVGRALIQVILKRRGLVDAVVPPVSLVLATNKSEYLSALEATHFDGTPEQNRGAIQDWISFFADATDKACHEMERIDGALAGLRKVWVERLGVVRSDATVLRVLDVLQGMPVVTVSALAEALGRSVPAVGAAVNRCVEAGILTPTTKGKRNRVFEARDVLATFGMIERRLASPSGDTAIEGPGRAVPEIGAPGHLAADGYVLSSDEGALGGGGSE